MRKRLAVGERQMTKRDWKALYVVHRLAEQVVLHGAGALDTFAEAWSAARASVSPGRTDTKNSTGEK